VVANPSTAPHRSNALIDAVTPLRRILILGTLLLGCCLTPSRTWATAFDREHGLLDAVLKRHVRNARVDYAALRSQPEGLKQYLTAVRQVSRAEFKAWSEADQIAFLCNAYNAHTLRLILDHYPVKSIQDIGSILKGPWDQPVVQLFGDTRTLNDLEHRMLRVDYAEPLIHFALVCAAKGCPPLRAEAFVGSRLGEQLADQARAFLAETAKNRIDPERRTVYLSPIFKWYGTDFEAKGSSVLSRLQPYWREEWRALSLKGFKLRYTKYDWSLNDRDP